MGYLEKRATSADTIENVGNKSLANKWNERLFILQADSIMYLAKPELTTTPVQKSHLSAVDTFAAKGSECSAKHVVITAETTVSVLEIAEEWGDKEYVFEVSTSNETGGGGPFRFILCAEDEWTMRAWIAAITACACAKRQSSIAGAKVSHHRALHPAGIAQMKEAMNAALPDCDGELARISARLVHVASGVTAADAVSKPVSGAAAAMATPPTTVKRLSSHEASRRFTELVDKFKDPSINLSLSSMWAHALPGSKHAEAFTPKRAVELLHANRSCPLRFTVFADCLLRLALEDREFREHTEAFDFYLPQILHLADLPHATQRLEDVVVALAAMSIKLALRIVWYLWGNHEDTMGHFADLEARKSAQPYVGVVHPSYERLAGGRSALRSHDWPHFFARSERLLLRVRDVVRRYDTRAPGAKDDALPTDFVLAHLSEPLGVLAPFQALADEAADSAVEADDEHMDDRLFAAWVLAHTDSAGRAAIWAAGLIPAAAGDEGRGLAEADAAWVALSPALGGAAAIDPTRPLSKAAEAECRALELSTFADAPAPAGVAAGAAAGAAAPAAVVPTAFGSQLRFWYNVTNVAEVLRKDISEETVAKANPKCKDKKAQVKRERKVLMPELITPEKLPIEPLGTCFYPVTSLSYVAAAACVPSPRPQFASSLLRCCACGQEDHFARARARARVRFSRAHRWSPSAALAPSRCRASRLPSRFIFFAQFFLFAHLLFSFAAPLLCAALNRSAPLEEVARVSAVGARVFSTNERCPVMLNFETLVSTERAGAEAPAADAADSADAGAAGETAAASAAGETAAASVDGSATKADPGGATAVAAAAPAAVASAADVAVEVSAEDSAPVTRCRSNSLMGKPWKDTIEDIRAESAAAEGAVGDQPGWRLRSLLAKSNDDLRQEVFVMQLWKSMSVVLFFAPPLSFSFVCYSFLCSYAFFSLLPILFADFRLFVGPSSWLKWSDRYR